MGAQLQSNQPQPQVVGTTVADGQVVSFISSPSGSVLIRWISQDDFTSDRGNGLMGSLSDAVENILGEGIAVNAVGVQTVETSGFISDNVDFTVRYRPPYTALGTIETTVRIPVPTLVADTQFGSFLTGGSAVDQINAAYDHLRTLTGG